MLDQDEPREPDVKPLPTIIISLKPIIEKMESSVIFQKLEIFYLQCPCEGARPNNKKCSNNDLFSFIMRKIKFFT